MIVGSLLPGQTATWKDGEVTVSLPPACVQCWEPIKDHWYRVEHGSTVPYTGTAVVEWTPPLYCSARCLAAYAANMAGLELKERD